MVDLRASRDVAKRAAASLLEANKKQLSQLRPPLSPAANKQPIVKQVSEEGLLPLGDPYDDMYYHGGRGGGVKWNKTLVQSMTIGMGGSTSAANITYTDQGDQGIQFFVCRNFFNLKLNFHALQVFQVEQRSKTNMDRHEPIGK